MLNKKFLSFVIISIFFVISAEAKIKKIGNGLSIDIPDGYQYASINLRKLLSRFPITSKDFSKKDLKDLEEIGIGKSTKLILLTKNKKNIDFFNKITTPIGFNDLNIKYFEKFEKIYANEEYTNFFLKEFKKKYPNIDINKISENDFMELFIEIIEELQDDKDYKKINQKMDELVKPLRFDFLLEYPVDEPSMIIVVGDKKIKDKDLDQINNLPTNVAYQKILKEFNKDFLLKAMKLEETPFQIQKNQFGNMYMINNMKNTNVSQFFTEPQYSEYVLTTHKNKIFLAISSCSSKCNNSSTGTALGLVDILGHTNLFKSIKRGVVDVRY